MNDVRAAVLGLVITVVVAVWWLQGVADFLRSGSDTAPLAASALGAVLLLRIVTLCVAGSGIARGSSMTALLRRNALLAMMSWPLVLLLQWSSHVAALRVLIAEVALLALAAFAALLARLLQEPLPAAQSLPQSLPPSLAARQATAGPLTARQALATSAGIIAAICLWLGREHYLAWLLA